MNRHCESVIRAAQIALGERQGGIRPGMARQYIKALPEEYRTEAWAAVLYTQRKGFLPPIIRQALKREGRGEI